MSSALTDPRLSKYSTPVTQPVYQKMKEIRLCVPLSEVDKEKVPVGHYYKVDYNVPQGDAPIITPLGPTITVQILRHAMRLKNWIQGDGTTIESSEFRTYQDIVVLYDVADVKAPKVIAALPYQHKSPSLPQIGGKPKTGDMGKRYLKEELNLGVRYVMYVLHDGEFCRLNFTATDNSGCELVRDASGKKVEKPLPFGEENETSLTGMLRSMHSDDKEKLFLFDVEMGCEKISERVTIKTFTCLKEIAPERVAQTLDALDELYKALNDQSWTKFTKAMVNTNLEDLDVWSKRICERIAVTTLEPLLYSKNDAVFTMPTIEEAQVIETSRPKALPSSVEDIAADLEGGETKSARKRATRTSETGFDAVKNLWKEKTHQAAGDRAPEDGVDAGGDGPEE